MHHNPLCSALTAGMSVTKLENFQSKMKFPIQMSGRAVDKLGCLDSLVSRVSGTFHVKELRLDLYTFTSLPCLPSATQRRDIGPEMLVSEALLVAFKSTSRF